MKKMLLLGASCLIVSLCLPLTINTIRTDPSINLRLENKSPYEEPGRVIIPGPAYPLPNDPTILEEYDFNFNKTQRNTTFGRVAKLSDIIAIGHISTNIFYPYPDPRIEFSISPFDVCRQYETILKVETALLGCTNGQFIVIGTTTGLLHLTNDTQIVFCVFTNQYTDVKAGYIDWSADPQSNEHTRVFSRFRFDYDWRSSWSADLDDGLALGQFTNVLQAVRFDRNWTNYFHLCRDGVSSPSVRVAEDSFYDLCGLIIFASTNEARFIYNDPLVSPEHKAYLLERHPYVGE